MNLFPHYAFDAWMQCANPCCPFARYTDDAVVHCRGRRQAEEVERNRNSYTLIGFVEGCRSLLVASTGELWLRGTPIPIPFYRTAMHKPARYIDQKLE